MKKYIFITYSFQRNLKKLRRYFSEEDIVNDIKKFIKSGLRKGETYLKAHTVFEMKLKVAKLRICVHQATGRYLIGITEGERDYIPIIVDLKTGKIGENMSLENKKRVRNTIL